MSQLLLSCASLVFARDCEASKDKHEPHGQSRVEYCLEHAVGHFGTPRCFAINDTLGVVSFNRFDRFSFFGSDLQISTIRQGYPLGGLVEIVEFVRLELHVSTLGGRPIMRLYHEKETMSVDDADDLVQRLHAVARASSDDR